MNLPSFGTYGNYASDNYGVHTLRFTDADGNDWYYSYKTLVAARINGELFVRQNDWAQTTGKHLNWIDGGDKRSRLSGEDFQRAVSDALGVVA